MTIAPAPMPPVDPAALNCALVVHAPILETLAWQIAQDLWPEVRRVDASATPDSAFVIAYSGDSSCRLDLYMIEGDRLTATVTHGGLTAYFNAPDRSIASDMLARLRLRLHAAASSEICDFEHREGVEREVIPRAMNMTREEWIAATADDYWSEVPAAERHRLAGQLWDRIRRLSAKLNEVFR